MAKPTRLTVNEEPARPAPGTRRRWTLVLRCSIGAIAATVLVWWWFGWGERLSSTFPQADGVPLIGGAASNTELPVNSSASPEDALREAVVSHSTDDFRAVVSPGTAAVRGRVINPSGEPLSGVQVQIRVLREFAGFHPTAGMGSSGPPVAQSVRTNLGGEFWFDSLPACGEELEARFHHDGWAPERLVFPAQWGAVADIGDVIMSYGTRVHGVVLDEAGARVGGADVYAVRQSNNWRLVEARGERVAKSDSAGEFVVGPLAPGSYRFGAERGDFVSDWTPPVFCDASGAQADVEVHGWLGVTVEGSVLDALSSLPLQGTVTLSPFSGLRAHQAIAGPDGRFQIRGCRVGMTYNFHVTAAGYRPNSGTNAHTVSLQNGGVAPLIVRLHRLHSLVVHVRDARSGEPIKGAEVRGGPIPSGMERRFSFNTEFLTSLPVLATTDVNGIAQVDAPTGSVKLCVAAAGFAPQRLSLLRGQIEGAATNEAQSSVTCALLPGVRVLVDIGVGDSVRCNNEAWKVVLQGIGRRQLLPFDGTGHHQPDRGPVLRMLPLNHGLHAEFADVGPGEFAVLALSTAGRVATANISVGTSEDVSVVLKATQSAAVSGHITLPTHSSLSPLTRYQLLITDEDGGSRNAWLRPGGSFAVSGLRPGKAILQLSTAAQPWLLTGEDIDGAYIVHTQSAVLEPGQNTLNISALETLSSMAGVVLVNGRIKPGLQVSVFRLDPEPRRLAFVARVTTDTQGRFEFTPIPAGAYRVFLSDCSLKGADLDLARKDIAITPVESRIVTFEVHTGSLTLLARSAEARARLRFQAVTIAAEVDQSANGGLNFNLDVPLDGNGAARVPHLCAGDYLLRLPNGDDRTDLRFSIVPGKITEVSL